MSPAVLVVFAHFMSLDFSPICLHKFLLFVTAVSFLVTFFARNDRRNPLRLVYILFKLKKTFGPCKKNSDTT